jgi:hypothetical protein
MNRVALIIVLACLGACTSSPNALRITQEPLADKVQAKSRSEPIFYNGKTYQLDFGPDANGGYAMAVSGMSAKQEKDAVAVSTSALRYYACKDSQTSKLISKPAYRNTKWEMSAQCV